MYRPLIATLATLCLSTAASAQSAPPWRGSGPPSTQAEGAERHLWVDENWDSLPPAERRQAEERFHRGMGSRGPSAEEMRDRWQSMSPGQRQELMFGLHMRQGRHGQGRRRPGMNSRSGSVPESPSASVPESGR